MPQHPPAPDETVRMRADGPTGRPTLEGPRATPPAVATATGQTPVHAQGSAQSAAATSGRLPEPTRAPAADAPPADTTATDAPAPAAVDTDTDGEPDDTRPVTRDWLLGAPESERAAGNATGVVSAEPLGQQDGDTQQIDRSATHDTAPVDGPPAPDDVDATRMIEDSRRRRPRLPRRSAAR